MYTHTFARARARERERERKMAPEEAGVGGSGGAGAVHATRAQGQLQHAAAVAAAAAAGTGTGGMVTSDKQNSSLHSQQHYSTIKGRSTPPTTTTTGNGSGISRAALMAATESTAAALPESLYTVRWSAEEQKLLEDSLRMTETSCTPLERYIAVAALLPHKGVRGVALRVRWMNRKVQRERGGGHDTHIQRDHCEVVRKKEGRGDTLHTCLVRAIGRRRACIPRTYPPPEDRMLMDGRGTGPPSINIYGSAGMKESKEYGDALSEEYDCTHYEG